MAEASPALESAARTLRAAGVEELLRRGEMQLGDAISAIQQASSAARSGQLAKSAGILVRSLVARPLHRDTRLALAWVMLQRDFPLQALALIDELLLHCLDDLEATERKAFILIQLRRLNEALDLYSALLTRTPDNPRLLVARGQIHLALGNGDRAVADYRRATCVAPGFGGGWWALANVKSNQLDENDVAAMRSLIAHPQLPAASRIDLDFALGKALEDAGSYEQSFAHYRSGNEQRAIGAFRTRPATRRHVDQSIALLGTRELDSVAGNECDAPIFIVGMPRAGSTLVEQILASHPDVEGTAELPTISALARSLGEDLGRSDLEYVDLLDGYSADFLSDLGQRYIEQASAYRLTDRRFFIDKMPSNWMHLGLIRRILPRARIIDVRRHPLDCCFSNYAQNFQRGHEFTNNFADLADQYRDYLRFMDHVDRSAPQIVVRVNFENLVAQPERQIRTLLDRLDLPFSEACLRFFENDRAVMSPSAPQVRRPINRSGIDRWRAYEPWLGPLKEALADATSKPA